MGLRLQHMINDKNRKISLKSKIPAVDKHISLFQSAMLKDDIVKFR